MNSEGIDIYGRGSLEQQADRAIVRAEEAMPEMMQLARSVARMFGGTAVEEGQLIKSRNSIIRKSKAERTKPKKLRDVLRTTVVVEADGVEQAKEYFEKLARKSNPTNDSTKLVRTKRQDTDVGYTGFIYNGRSKRNGISYEIQVNTPEMIYAKHPMNEAVSILGMQRYRALRKRFGYGGVGHRLYEDYRSVASSKRIRNKAKQRSLQYYGDIVGKKKK